MVHAMEEMLKEKEEDEDEGEHEGEEGNDDEELAVEEEIKIKRRCNDSFSLKHSLFEGTETSLC